MHFSNIWFLVSNLMHLFIISFHIPLHVSSHIVLIIRRIYCIYTASGSLYVTLLMWPFSAQAVRVLEQPVHWTVTQEEWHIKNPMLCIYSRSSWWWAQYGSKHVEEYERHIINKENCIRLELKSNITKIQGQLHIKIMQTNYKILRLLK